MALFPAGVPANRARLFALAATGLAAMALALAAAAALGVVGVSDAIAGCVAFAILAAADYALLRSGRMAQWSIENLVTTQLAVLLLVLAWVTFLAAQASAAILLLYFVALAYGALHLERGRLLILDVAALVSNGTATFMAIDDGRALGVATALAGIAALALALAWLTYAAGAVSRLRERIAQAHQRLHQLGLDADERASRDPLTGVYHHRHLMDALEREMARSERLGKPLSIARVDLDGLGAVNEAHGHAVGDIALKKFVAAAQGALRDVDVFGRQGGKEFLVLMPDTDLKGAQVAAGRVLAAVIREPLPETQGRTHLGCTLGVTEHRAGENLRLLLARAESGLSYGKAAGRGRVIALGADGAPVGAATS